MRPHKNMALLTLEGVHDPETARELVGTVFYIARAEAKLPKGHYFKADLLGLPRKGRIAPGCDADFVVLGEDLTVLRTIVGGRTVYTAE